MHEETTTTLAPERAIAAAGAAELPMLCIASVRITHIETPGRYLHRSHVIRLSVRSIALSTGHDGATSWGFRCG